MSFKLVPFESVGAVSYSPSIVTIALSCIISEINRDICQKSSFFSDLLAFDAPVIIYRGSGSPLEYRHPIWCGKIRMVGLPDGENKKLSCHRETARRFVSLNILLSHSRSFEMTLLCKPCVSPY